MAAARPMIAPKVPNARPRRSGGSSRRMRATVAGTTSAPPQAISTRATVRAARLGATRPSRAPVPIVACANEMTRHWPNRSASFPPGLCRAIAVMRYVATSACVTVVTECPNSAATAGTATATMVEFSGIRLAVSRAANSLRATP